MQESEGQRALYFSVNSNAIKQHIRNRDVPSHYLCGQLKQVLSNAEPDGQACTLQDSPIPTRSPDLTSNERPWRTAGPSCKKHTEYQ